MKDLQDIVHELKAKGFTLGATEQLHQIIAKPEPLEMRSASNGGHANG